MGDGDSLAGREKVLAVLENLQAELESGADWENDSLARFLEGFGALLGSIENVYLNSNSALPDDPWALVAEALEGAPYYE